MAWQGNSSNVGDFNNAYSFYQAPPEDQTNSYMQYDDGNDWDDDEEYPSATFDLTTFQPFGANTNTGADISHQPSVIPGLTSPPDQSQEQKQDLAINTEEKAAMLKAKLLEKRTNSRGPVPGSVARPPPAISSRATPKRQDSSAAVDSLVRETREAVDAQLRQKKNPPESNPKPNGSASLIVRPASPAASTLSKISTGKTSKKAKTNEPQLAKKSRKPLSPSKQAERQEKNRTAGLNNGGADGNAGQQVSTKNESRSKSNKTATENPNQTAKSPEVGPSRSETLNSTATMQPDMALNGKHVNSNTINTAPNVNASEKARPAGQNDAAAPDSNALVALNFNGPQGRTREMQHAVPSGMAAQFSRHFEDLDEWLEITGYHDQAKRNRILSLHRQRAGLERQLAEVDQELSTNMSTKAKLPRPLLIKDMPAADSSMLPPPATKAGTATVSGTKRARSPESPPTEPVDKHRRTVSTSRPSQSDRNAIAGASLKTPDRPAASRVVSDEKKATSVHPDRQKLQSHGRARSHSPLLLARRTSISRDQGHEPSRHSKRESSPRPEIHPSRSPIPSNWNAYRPAYVAKKENAPTRRGPSHARPGAPMGSRHTYDKGAAGLDLWNGNCRYFMVKSWNYDNVQIAQQNGLWCTQVQNEELFTEAFNTSRHVIFFFSVNNSKAFQGYARMESLPGSAPAPSWVSGLKWPTSAPFHIRWITISETRFSRVGHLKNALNENMPVLVGRDGQEVEEQCGAALCELLDEESRSADSGYWY